MAKKSKTDADYEDEVKKLIRAQAAVRKSVSDDAKKAAKALAKGMSDADWRDYQAVTRYAKANAKVSAARQRQIAAAQNAYQARVLALLTGKPVAPAKQVDVDELRGIPQESVYGRIADYYRYLTDNPARLEPQSTAKALTADRAEEVAEMDITLAVRAQNQQVTKEKKQVKYYRRVIHPELNESGASCGLCIVASHNTYAKGQLLPIHFRCKCEVVPVTDENADYGQAINDADIQSVYAKAGATTAQELKETRFTIRQHGELGPVLTYEGNRFRGPSQVEDDTTHDKETPS